jgi:hypothetical protein
MFQPVIRRILRWIIFSLVLVLLFGAPRICRSQEGAAEAGVNGMTPLTVPSVTTDFVLFGVLGLAVASAAIAVRMVRRWH